MQASAHTVTPHRGRPLTDSVTRCALSAGVTLVIAFGWLSVFLDLVAGVGLLLLANNPDALPGLGIAPGTATAAAIGSFIGASVLAFVVFRLGRGGRIARILVTVVFLARLAFAAWILVAAGSHNLGESLLSIAVALTALGRASGV